MRTLGLVPLLPLLVAATPSPLPSPPGRETIGVFGGWAAFAAPDHCHAVAAPVTAGGSSRWRAFASVGTWPARRLRSSLHIRLSRERDRSAGVTLSVGERRFRLAATGVDAWAPDDPGNRAIVAALRSARSMSVEAVGAGGRPFADTYALAGAATAIDAALLACRSR